MKNLLIGEFHKEYSCIELHKKLSERKKRDNEPAMGTIDEKSIVRYVVDGLKIKNDLKFSFSEAKTLNELRDKFETYETVSPGEKLENSGRYKKNWQDKINRKIE